MSDITQPSQHQVIIQANRGWAALELRELWEYRDLIYLLIWREIQGRYRQTALGTTWMFLRPLVNVLVMTLAFGVLIQVPSDQIPYPLFSLSALLPWGYFSVAVGRASNSLVENTHLISKVYFPRLAMPLVSVLSGLVDFIPTFLIFLGLLVYYRYPLRWEMLWLPVFILVALALALGGGLWLATLSALYRDVNYAVGFLLQALMYASPVIYSSSLIPDKMRFWYNLNPMTGVINGFRWALLGSGNPPAGDFLLAVGIILLLVVSGAFIFRRTERSIVDVI